MEWTIDESKIQEAVEGGGIVPVAWNFHQDT